MAEDSETVQESDRSATVTWIGHSTVLVELDAVRLLTDPLLRPRVGHVRRVAPEPTDRAREVDAILVSHVHHDHLDVPSLRLVRSEQTVVPRGAGSLLRRRGFEVVREIAVGEKMSIGPVSVRATHAEHSARRGLFGSRTRALGFLISGSARLYFAGDTDLFLAMRDLRPKLDVALLPISGWGPRLPAGHMDAQRAALALDLLQPRFAIPIHWGTYLRMGFRRDAEALHEPAKSFERQAAEVAPDVGVRILSPGESFRVSP